MIVMKMEQKGIIMSKMTRKVYSHANHTKRTEVTIFLLGKLFHDRRFYPWPGPKAWMHSAQRKVWASKGTGSPRHWCHAPVPHASGTGLRSPFLSLFIPKSIAALPNL